MIHRETESVSGASGTAEDKDDIQSDQTTKQDRGASVSRRRRIFRGLIWTPVKALLYLAFLCIAVVALFLLLDRLAEFSLRRSNLGEVYPKDFSLARKDYTRPTSHYDYDFVPGVCIQYDIYKGNRYEYANNAGFREPSDISLQKPNDEFRVFLTGGSTAFGLGPTGEAAMSIGPNCIEYRETISHVMEMILNATASIPGKKIRVYNAAVWGYAYQHNLMRYLAKLRRYKPDLVISLDGANEIPLISKLDPDWDYFREGQYNNIIRQIFSYDKPGLASYVTLWLKNNTFLMAHLWAGRDSFQELAFGLLMRSEAVAGQGPPPNPPELSVEEMSRLADANVATVVRMVENYHTALKNDGVTHLLALQPWFYLSKKKHDEKEKALADLTGARHYHGVPSDKMYKLLIDKIIESATKNGYPVVDFSEYFDDVSECVFTDWCHLTPGANYLVAKELANIVKEKVLGQPLAAGDRIDDKDVFFWDLAASAKVSYAPPADNPASQVGNMLSGYPGQDIYSSKVVGPDERLEVVLELPRRFLVSRVRVVWGEEESVPEQWVVETSTDGETWRSFVQSDNTRTDSYSRWPGFEYYAAEPVEALYLRYRPLRTKQRSIRIRSWSVSRYYSFALS